MQAANARLQLSLILRCSRVDVSCIPTAAEGCRQRHRLASKLSRLSLSCSQGHGCSFVQTAVDLREEL